MSNAEEMRGAILYMAYKKMEALSSKVRDALLAGNEKEAYELVCGTLEVFEVIITLKKSTGLDASKDEYWRDEMKSLYADFSPLREPINLN